MMKPADGYIAYIVNPKSGSRGNQLTAHRFAEYLNQKGFETRTTFTASLQDACKQAAFAAADAGCAMVVAAGGDGTIREVAHGLEGRDKPMMVVPCGTENLLANELGLDNRLKTMIETFENGTIRSLDVGNADGRCFTSVVGAGFDGQVVKLVSDNRMGHISHLHYFWPLWKTFWGYKFPAMQVSIDGTEVFEGQGLVFVGNISRYAVGLEILHKADFGDGLLDLCIYKCGSKLHLIKHSIMTVLKHHAYASDVIYRQGRQFHISSDYPELRTEIDGDPGPDLPVDISVIPQAVKVIMPAGAKPAGIRTRIKRLFR